MTVALIPAYEPDKKLIALLEDIKANTDFNVVVVNDGSKKDKDPIFERAKEFATVLYHDKNYGKGKALRTGIEYIGKNFPEDTVIVTMDADGQHTVPDALRVVAAVEDTSYQLVVGGRKFTGNVPLRSRMGNSITRFVYRISTGVKVHDTQSGLRAFGVGMIPFMLKLEGDRYEYEMNMLLFCAKHKIPIDEVEIETIYIEDNASSHFNALRDSFRIYKNILKFSASSLLSFVIDYSLFTVLVKLLAFPLSAGNVVARIISSIFNFFINKRFVFHNKDKIWKAALRYFALVAALLVLNTVLLRLMVAYVLPDEMWSKLVVEVVMFFVSWTVQKMFVFKKKKKA